MWSDHDRLSHSPEACARLLDRFLLPPDELRRILTPEATHSPDANRAILGLLGRALWDVFSQNHTVLDAEGRAYDLGSFRASAVLIADAIDCAYSHPAGAHDYLDFYMGTTMGEEAIDLRAVYRWIFSGLKEAGCYWIYSFARLYLVDFGGRQPNDDMLRYDPGEATRAELEQLGRAKQVHDLAEQFESWHQADLRSARQEPLPVIVAAYRDVFDTLPEGWPHPDM